MILTGEIGPWGPIVRVEVRAPGGDLVEVGNAIMDSGARLSVVDASLAEKVGASVVGTHKAKGVCGSCDMQRFLCELTIGGVRFEGAELLGKPDLLPFVALLGQDFLSTGILVCDGPRKKYRFEMG